MRISAFGRSTTLWKIAETGRVPRKKSLRVAKI